MACLKLLKAFENFWRKPERGPAVRILHGDKNGAIQHNNEPGGLQDYSGQSSNGGQPEKGMGRQRNDHLWRPLKLADRALDRAKKDENAENAIKNTGEPIR